MSNASTEGVKGRLAEQQPTGTAVERAQERPASAAEVVRRAIENQTVAFKAVLPAGYEAERFSRLVLTAVKASPQLMECFGSQQGQTSMLLAAMQAASVGLEPNTPTQDCWLLPRRNKGTMECQLSIGYRGLLKLARRSGTIKTIFAEVVREKDVFHWSRGLEEDVLEHVPYDGEGDAGPLTHVYAVARYKEGGYSFIVLNRAQVEQRRGQSDSFKNGQAFSPWTKWPEAMWRKSALRALLPYLELQTDDARALANDEVSLRFNADDGVIDIDDDEKDPAPQLPPAPAPDEEEEREAAREDTEKQRKGLMAQATKAFPLAELRGKAQSDQRSLYRRAVSYAELGEHKSSNDMTAAEIARVYNRLQEVVDGIVTVALSESASDVLITRGDQTIEVAIDAITDAQ